MITGRALVVRRNSVPGTLQAARVPVFQPVEKRSSNLRQCGFESHRGHPATSHLDVRDRCGTPGCAATVTKTQRWYVQLSISYPSYGITPKNGRTTSSKTIGSQRWSLSHIGRLAR